MSGETSNLRRFFELEWFKWVIFVIKLHHSQDVLKLGHYLGPSIDIGPAMTAKVLTENEKVLHRSTHQSFTQDELQVKDGSVASEQLMTRVYDRLGSLVIPKDMED